MSLLLLLNPDSQQPSHRFVKAAFKQETDEVVVALLTIEHPDLVPPARVCSDAVDITSRGNVFTGGVPFLITLPDQDPETQARVRLTMDVIDQTLVAVVQSIPADSPPTVTLEVVLAATPDVVESGPYAFTLRNAEGDITTIEGELAFEDLLSEPFPADSFTPASHPGLF
ncbi:DUF1833 family protein [Dongia deserti]|uniref:DUF1833 family protein n=1 Tax=Dongia deserti TaxID=2268030 RepID=UPI0013C430D4|nr:DUF1833 family protein [Dongia deserti]